MILEKIFLPELNFCHYLVFITNIGGKICILQTLYFHNSWRTCRSMNLISVLIGTREIIELENSHVGINFFAWRSPN